MLICLHEARKINFRMTCIFSNEEALLYIASKQPFGVRKKLLWSFNGIYKKPPCRVANEVTGIA